MKIDILTLFPEMYEGFLTTSIIKRAINNNLVEINLHNFRDFSNDPHNHVDDTPYGGGQGMLLRVDPIVECLNTIRTRESQVILLSPQGKTFSQNEAAKLTSYKHLILICGHYEGFDERVRDYIDYEISLGDYVLTGGELASMVLCDATIRLLDGVIRKSSYENDSFSDGLLEAPQYTRPYEYDGNKVPDILLSGNHKEIEIWRRKASLKNTFNKRPDLLSKTKLDDFDLEYLESLKNS